MGLFDRKRTSFYDAQPYYTIGNSQTILIVGLGNPGKEHASQRHNIGFMAVDRYHASQDFSGWVLKKDLKAMVADGMVGPTKVILAKPTTYMNNSGEAVQALQHFYRIGNSDTLVVYDELDVKFGMIRTRNGGGAGGHNGIKSLITHVGEEFGRIRVGIGPKRPAQIDSAAFVLTDFTKKQQESIASILRETSVILDERTVGPLQDHSITL